MVDETWQQSAEWLSKTVKDDKDFVKAVYRKVQRRVPWRCLTTFEVMSPDRAWKERYGDCSEQALLCKAMIEHCRPHIEARLVWGICPGRGRHDTVEIHLNKHYWILDAEFQQGFAKIGDGLVPGTVVK